MKLSSFTAAALSTSTMLSTPVHADPLSEVAIAQLDQAIESAISERRIAGAVVLVAKDGEIVFRRAAGLADIDGGVEMREDTIFRFTSVSKPIVTAAAMRLVEMGLLDLDAAVTDWLPQFHPQFEGTSPDITLRQLLSHSSGIGYTADEGGSGPYTEAGVQDGGFGTGITLEENLARLASAPLRFAPGTGWNYGLGIDVIGRVIEVATQEPIEVAVRDLVTEPLNMHDTVYHVPAWDNDRLAVNYQDGADGPVLIEDDVPVPLGPYSVKFEPSRVTDPDAWPSSGAGMAGTADDVMKLLLALTKQDGFLDGAMAEQMMTPQTEAAPLIDMWIDLYAGLPKTGAAWGFGLGGAVLIDPALANTPQSAGTLSWTGAYGNTWFVDPAENLVVVALTNTAWEGIYGTFPHEIRDAVYATE